MFRYSYDAYHDKSTVISKPLPPWEESVSRGRDLLTVDKCLGPIHELYLHCIITYCGDAVGLTDRKQFPACKTWMCRDGQAI